LSLFLDNVFEEQYSPENNHAIESYKKGEAEVLDEYVPVSLSGILHLSGTVQPVSVLQSLESPRQLLWESQTLG
jgi:hypothetical protein